MTMIDRYMVSYDTRLVFSEVLHTHVVFLKLSLFILKLFLITRRIPHYLLFENL